MNEPIVSVVMVVCNVERFLAESMESILQQTFTNFEFIVVDFGSSDKSKQIVSNYAALDHRIRLHEIPHRGLAEARNAAFSLARGQYIAIMDADDVALPERLRWEVEFLEAHPEVGLVGGGTEWIDAAGRSICTNEFPAEDKELRLELARRCAFCQPTVLVRREAVTLAGGYREAFTPAEDYDLWLRVVEHFQCANLTQVVLRYRIHPQQISMRKQRRQTLGMLAAKASASIRRSGKPDPLEGVQEITPQLLVSLGVSEAAQENEFVLQSRLWVRHMCMAGDDSAAFKAAVELLQSNWKYVERWQISDLHLTIAGLYWRQRKFLKCFLAAGRAVLKRPMVIGRPLKQWWHRPRST
jgi:glycosyltransferase involved in cell wall biosynthesis